MCPVLGRHNEHSSCELEGVEARSCVTLLGKLVAFTADGAAVNLGSRGGVAAKLRGECPWLIDVWCMPHRLDLTVRKIVQDCPAAQMIGVLELVYKTYHYSPKSRRELYELGVELDVAVLSPSRAKGTRWSPHIQSAMAVMPRPAKDGAPSRHNGQGETHTKTNDEG